jgi:osomolarity two-component system, response regulator SSK1
MHPPSRGRPDFDTLLLQWLLDHLGASLMPDLQPRSFQVGRTCELTTILDSGSPDTPPLPSPDSASPTSDTRISDEPTMAELTQFVENLKGKKAMLYASSRCSFAHHLTSYLTAWGLDVSHVSRETEVEESTDRPGGSTMGESTLDSSAMQSMLSAYPPNHDTLAPLRVEGSSSSPHTLSFILIDDDVTILRERLHAFYADLPNPFNLNSRKQSALAGGSYRRGYRSLNQIKSPDSSPSGVIIHFTSLAHYKSTKNIVHSTLASYASSSTIQPEVMIIPKPVGPRRFLTALHTAITKPSVDPYFSPIATSPNTPGSRTGSPSTTNTPRSPTNRPFGTRHNSERSDRPGKDGLKEYSSLPPPSPLGMSDRNEYFPETAVKLGTSPSSGLVIQSPDGQPAGIVFQPRAKSPRRPNASGLDKDIAQMLASSARRVSAPRRISGGELKAFQGGISISTLLPPPISPKLQPLGLDGRESSSQESALPSPVPKSPEIRFSSTPVQATPPIPSHSTSSETIPRKVVSPTVTPSTNEISSPNSPRRKGTAKQPPLDRTSSFLSARRGKGPADANVVPPISVLVVDGIYHVCCVTWLN